MVKLVTFRKTAFIVMIFMIIGIWSSFDEKLVSGQSQEKSEKSASIQSQMSYEEATIRWAYLKLMYYNSNASKDLAQSSNRAYKPEDDIKLEVSDVHTGPISEVYAQSVDNLAARPSGEIVRVALRQRTIKGTEERVNYGAEWVKGQYVSAVAPREISLRELFNLLGEKYSDIGKYSTYKVAVSLAGKSRTYSAMVLYHSPYQSTTDLKPEFWDSVVGMGGTITDIWNETRPPVGSEKKRLDPNSKDFSLPNHVQKENAAKLIRPYGCDSMQPLCCPWGASSLTECKWDSNYSWDAPKSTNTGQLDLQYHFNSQSESTVEGQSFVGGVTNASLVSTCNVVDNIIHTPPIPYTGPEQHNGGGHHAYTEVAFQCKRDASCNLFCNPGLEQAGFWDDAATVPLYGGLFTQYHVGKMDSSLLGDSNSGSNGGGSVSCKGGAGYAFRSCPTAFCSVSLSVSWGITITSTGGELANVNGHGRNHTCNFQPDPTPTPTPRPTPRVVSDEERKCEEELSNNFNSACNTSSFGIGEARTLSPNRSCCRISPLVVDMDGDSFHYTDVAGGVKFDLTGDGRKFQVAWPTVTSGDAWLVLDRNGNGTIDSGRELFGNFTAQVADVQTGNGFLALAEYDKPVYGGNGDGVINAQDEVFSFLQLWQDANHNGVSDPNELTTVASRNIVSLPLTYTEATVTDQYGNRFSLKNNVTLSDGSQRVICDAYPLFVPMELELAVELFLCDGTGLVAGTVSWSGPPTSQVRFDSPQGELFGYGIITGSKVTEKELYTGRVIYLVDAADGQVLASKTVSIGNVTPMNSGTCVLYADTIQTCDGAGSTTVSWNATSYAPGATATQVRLGSFNGPVFASGGAQGSQVGNFSAPQTFFLVNVTNGSPGVLLKTFTVGFTTPTQGCAISASPNPIRACDGTGLATANLKWNAPEVSTTEIRLNSVTGQVVASGGSTGNFTTGKWVTNGMKFVLRNAGTGAEIGSATVVVTSNNCGTTKSDFDHDRNTDLTVWRGTETNWLITPSAGGAIQTVSWGSGNAPYNDQIVPGDYDGDGKTDLAVWRPNLGEWWIKRSSDAQIQQVGWGSGVAPFNDVPVPGDYDGDGKTDLAVWRPSEGNWYIWRSSDAQWQIKPWGSGVAPYNDIPVPADYDGDGKTDLAVWRTSDNKWYIKRSSDYQVQITAWGSSESQYNDLPVPADYDGDYKADLAVFRRSTGTWYILKSSDGTSITQAWGLGTDIPVPGDYDGDSKMDIAVWRPSDGTWYVIRSSNGTWLVQQHGQQGDTPVPSAGVR